MKQALLFILLFSSYSLFGNPQSKNIFISPFQLPYGGAGVAAAQEDLSYLINPAILGFYRRSQIGVAYHSLLGESESEEVYHKTITSFADKSSLFPIGITYERIWDNKFEKTYGEKWEVSLGTLIQRFLAIGLAVQKIKPTETSQEPVLVASKDKKESFLWEAKAGLLLKLRSKTHVGFTLNNAFSYLKDSEKNQMDWIVGVHQNWSNFLNMRMDINYKGSDQWTLQAGTETFIKKFLAVRLGGYWIPALDDAEKDTVFLGLGIGFHGPRLKGNLSYIAPAGSFKDKEFAFTASCVF